jgi:hypothetical protein
MGSNVVVVEVKSKNNGNLFFGPLGRVVRGRFELTNATRHNPAASALANRFSEPIPGQYISVDVERGEGFIIEPLHEDKHEAIRDRLKKKFKIEPAKQTFERIDVNTWLFWLRRAVDAGLAEVTAGSLPEKVEGAKMDLFIPHRTSETAKLTAAIDRQTDILSKLLSTLLEDRKRQK